MKQFVYLDTDIVNSIIAQTEKGLISARSTETEDLQNTTTSKGGHVAIDAAAEGGLGILAKLHGGLAINGEIANETQAQSVLREIASITLHDAAYDIAYEQIKKSYDLDPEKANNAELGDFVELHRAFEFVDLDYIIGLFSEDGIIDFLKKNAKNEIEATMQAQSQTETNRDQRRSSTGGFAREVRLKVESSDKEFDNIRDIIHAVKNIIPYSRMLVSSDGFLIPLEDKYFRDNPKTIGFKHGGETTCVGYITNVIGKNTVRIDNIFSNLKYSVNEALRSLLPTNEDILYIVNPVAVYYGK